MKVSAIVVGSKVNCNGIIRKFFKEVISYRLEMFVAETELKCTRDGIIFLMPHHLKNTL